MQNIFTNLLKLITFTHLLLLFEGKLKCGDELNIDICYLSGDEKGIEVNYVKACPVGKFCSIKNNVGVCVKREDRLPEGEKCIFPYECDSGLCQNGVCVVLDDGEICKNDNECALSSICKRNGLFNLCTPMSPRGLECDPELDSADCQIGLFCSNNLCTDPGSIKTGRDSTYNMTCQTGRIEVVNGRSVCVSLTKNYECALNADNTQTCGVNIYDGAVTDPKGVKPCNKTFDNKYVCPTEANNALRNYITIYVKEAKKLNKNEKKNRKINRFTLGKKKVLNAYVEYYYYANIKGADDCIKNFYKKLASYSKFLHISWKILFFSIFSIFLA